MSASEETSRASTAAGIVKCVIMNPLVSPYAHCICYFFRDLRGHVHHIKDLQKRSRPWDSDVEFQRQQ
jgi:hypothetical protein